MPSPDTYRQTIYAFRFALWAATEFKAELDAAIFDGKWRALVEYIQNKNFSAASAVIGELFGIRLNEGEKLTEGVNRVLATYRDYDRIKRQAGRESTRVEMAWKTGCWDQFKQDQIQLATILKDANEQ